MQNDASPPLVSRAALWGLACVLSARGQRKPSHVIPCPATVTVLFPPGGCGRRARAGSPELQRGTGRQGWKAHPFYLVRHRRLWTCVDFGQSISLRNQETWCLDTLSETGNVRRLSILNRTLLQTQATFWHYILYCFSYISRYKPLCLTVKFAKQSIKRTPRTKIHCI